MKHSFTLALSSQFICCKTHQSSDFTDISSLNSIYDLFETNVRVSLKYRCVAHYTRFLWQYLVQTQKKNKTPITFFDFKETFLNNEQGNSNCRTSKIEDSNSSLSKTHFKKSRRKLCSTFYIHRYTTLSFRCSELKTLIPTIQVMYRREIHWRRRSRKFSPDTCSIGQIS